MIYFDDAVKVATTFINNTFSNSDEYDNEILCMELEQKRWLNFSKGSVEKQVADICEYLTVDAITKAIKRDRLNDYVKEVKANIYGIAVEHTQEGYWIAYAENNTPIMLRCSICTHSVVWGSVAKYCPNCGADMRNERILSCDRTKCHENEINDVPCEECECYSDTRGEE